MNRQIIPAEIEQRIILRFVDLEKEEKVKIVYAVESGSRAWGFESADSDYDIRFIFCRPTNHYLEIDERRDVIELPITDDLDFSGWDIKKALKLFRKSNPPLLEWLDSPHVYVDKYDFSRALRDALPHRFSPTASFYHYLHMAQNNFKKYLIHERVQHKKYFYVLRPVLAGKWLEAGYGSVPTKFETLLRRTIPDGELLTLVTDLLHRKRQGMEKTLEPNIPVLHDFLATELQRLSKMHLEKDTRKQSNDDLNRLFQSTLEKAWDSS